MEKHEQENYSENEDDPDVYESSGDEWNEEVEEKKRGNRRTSQRLSKKPRISHVELSSDSDGGDKKPKSKNGIKRQKLDPDVEDDEGEGGGEEEEVEEEEEEDDEESGADAPSPQSANNKNNVKRATPAPGSKIATADFVNGGFLILKRDAKAIDSRPCLWRIDGKALLQKYEPVDEDGKLRHRNTSIYTGWSSLDKDMYYPVSVKVLQHQGQNMTVEFIVEKLKELIEKSE